ncbi:DEAD/DEAH box helicase family protein [Aneurinibacillus terranovensis]|uniref:DEAD/DEAH box helicase family protein n=1 Tax=Aneurinibacillus terranovensis TaxID=278991 RepID=UPI0004289B53|nr:DEAD/DEAH box helicase family protein [Aneurinibacillus terranovensis]
MLRSLNLESIYDSSEHNLIQDLFVPLLKNSRKYYRGVGFFTSGWLMLAAQGLEGLIENGGRAVFITSPQLEAEDWYALRQGHEARKNQIVYDRLQQHIYKMESMLQENTCIALAWMVADGLLEFKFAVPKNKQGNFHDKFGVFEDAEGNRVAIHGSFNDSIQGTLNGESFSVFRSWESGQVDYVDKHLNRFRNLYENANEFYEMFDMTDAIKKSIVKLRKNRARPYSLPVMNQGGIRIPEDVSLFPYQNEALDTWFNEGCRGMFEMATGTGKTFTSLACAVKFHQKYKSSAVIVSCPFNHLVDQWEEDVIRFGFVPILCRDSSAKWLPKLKSRIQDFNLGARKSLFIITTHKTGSEKNFLSIVSKLHGNVLYIADEVHYLGSRKLRNGCLERFPYRIGLSATPERWYDESGSAFVREYFGKTVANFPLEDAIGTFLTPYRFIPHTVSLTEEEMNEFNELTDKIVKLCQRDKEENSELIEHYVRKRAMLVAKAQNKGTLFRSLMEESIRKSGLEKIKHTIVYCAPGETSKIVDILLSMGIRAHEFVYRVDNNLRVKLLKQFEEGDIQILVAIKCLDEGVNIPATREAYFLASTTNPREFVQRRGRILRRADGKKRAVLHDFIVVPPKRGFGTPHEVLEQDKALLRKEMPRFAEFSSAAENYFESRDVMYPILLQYDLISLLDKKPWDVYQENKKLWGEQDESIGSDS